MIEREVSVDYSERFLKHLRHLPKRLIEQANDKEAIFRSNPFDPRLDTHKLHGKDRDSWSFSASHKYRIKFLFITDSKILFLDIGKHDIYQ